ncbi:MAG: hypothetical protein ISS16_03840 [Ignavibacteria bacterium]|nr:hypothetical protein [Ignavibacteria bacterium]
MKKDHLNFLLALIIFIAIVGCGICNRSESNKEKLKDPEVKVSAETLVKDYRENEVSADDKYKNKVLEVTGVVRQVKKESLSRVIVILQKPKTYWGVKCLLDKEYNEDAGELRTGDEITIIGKCEGIKYRSPYLRNCCIK